MGCEKRASSCFVDGGRQRGDANWKEASVPGGARRSDPCAWQQIWRRDRELLKEGDDSGLGERAADVLDIHDDGLAPRAPAASDGQQPRTAAFFRRVELSNVFV